MSYKQLDTQGSVQESIRIPCHKQSWSWPKLWGDTSWCLYEICIQLIVCNPGACFSKVPKLFVWHNSLCIFKMKVFCVTKLSSYFNFYSLYNIWKDQLYKVSGSEFYEWLFGPVKFSGLLRNAHLDIYGGTAITKGKTPVPVCSPKLSPVGRGWYLDEWPSRYNTLCCTPWEVRLA